MIQKLRWARGYNVIAISHCPAAVNEVEVDSSNSCLSLSANDASKTCTG